MPLHVHFTQTLSPIEQETFARLLSPDIHLTTGDDDSVALSPGSAQVRAAELLVSGRPTRAWLDSLPHLRALIIPWAGVSKETRDLMREFPHIAAHNLHYNAHQTAEMALALLFAASKFVIPLDQKLRKGDWTPRYEPNRAFLLHGRTALILGFGNIGQVVGQTLKAVGMTVIGTVRSGGRQYAFADEIHPPSALPTLLPRANFLIITLPLTDETKGLIGARELARLPDDAILINVGRGPIVDEAALYDALKSGKLAAAGLDVWWNYPKDKESRSNTFPSNCPLQELDNVVLSPHRGGGVRERDESWASALAEMLNMYAQGKEMLNKVDLAAGY